MRGKKVHFNDDVQLIIFTDDKESVNLRKGFWEIIARDRYRFRDRICQTEECLAAVLTTAHRAHIYNHRFKDSINVK